MVQTDISQLCAETAEWRQILKNYKEEFQDCKKLLEDTCKQPLGKSQLKDVEHFDNQFHIQLINIHDVKQHIKMHERRIQFHLSRNSDLPEETFRHHEKLLDEFLSLENSLMLVRQEFKDFVNETTC